MEKINAIPSLTWHRLRVNEASEKGAFPPVPRRGWGAGDVTLVKVPRGITVDEDEPIACEELESGLGQYGDRLISENANSRWAVTVEKKIKNPLIIEDSVAAGCACVTCGSVYAVAGSALKIIHIFRGGEGGGQSLTRIYLEEGAQVELCEIQLLGAAVSRHCGVAAFGQAGSQFRYTRLELGGAVTVCGAKAVLSARSAAFDMACAYMGTGDEYLDFNDVANHIGRETGSEMHVFGVLGGTADKILRGTIDFRPGAGRSVGHESESVILMSPGVRNRTVPLILCGEEEVEGQHAASAGRLDEDALYYLNARGISPEEARRLMIEAGFRPVADRIPDAKLRDEVLEALGRRIASL